MAKLLIYIDHHDGEITRASWEALGAGRALCSELRAEMEAVLLGHDCAHLAKEIVERSGIPVHVGDHASLGAFRADAYADVLSPIAVEAAALILPDNGRTRELAAMLAVDMNVGLIPDATDLEAQGDGILATRAIYSGKVRSKVQGTGGSPVIVTLRSRAFAPDEGHGASGSVMDLEMGEVQSSIEVLGFDRSEGGVSLADAAVIVAGGRGMVNQPDLDPPAEVNDPEAVEAWRAKQGFAQLQELAKTVGAALGATRAVVDAGYVDYAHQIGQTGKVVSPDLYFAFGISGAIQHLAGIRSARTVVAINKDPDAPIFRSARFGLVADMHQMVPALIAAFAEIQDS